MALMPTSIGYQEIASLMARQAGVPHLAHVHLIPSPIGTIEPPTFSYGRRPIGTAIPEPPAIELVKFDPRSPDANAWSIDRPLQARDAALVDYPSVNRRLKGDRLPASNAAPSSAAPQSLPQLQPVKAGPPAPSLQAPPVAPATARPKEVDAPAAVPQRRDAAHGILLQETADLPAEIPAAGELEAPDGPSLSLAYDAPEERGTDIYFGAIGVGSAGGLQRWTGGAEPVMAAPGAEPAIKFAALERYESEGGSVDDSSRTESPAQRLGLAGKERVRAEKCLTDAVYFEARGEPLRGQEAVAQVVMNRVFSGYYPSNVCGVVYQNASHYLGCQFTFACEHKDLSRIDEPDMWAQAKRIAKDTLDGKIWLADIGHATHYHAYWVHPSWVHEMTRLYKLGVHTFYRPRAWGKGDYEPVWGAEPDSAKSEQTKPQANAAPADAADKTAATADL